MSFLGVKSVSQQSLLFVEGRGGQEEPSESTQFQGLSEAVVCILNFLFSGFSGASCRMECFISEGTDAKQVLVLHIKCCSICI